MEAVPVERADPAQAGRAATYRRAAAVAVQAADKPPVDKAAPVDTRPVIRRAGPANRERSVSVATEATVTHTTKGRKREAVRAEVAEAATTAAAVAGLVRAEFTAVTECQVGALAVDRRTSSRRQSSGANGEGGRTRSATV